ncbi:MAG TPA: hypothetical protein VGQ76_22385 [Thermoanaerobaculia bacterium]|jgi:hypothetical protein|nr:hypothetical protein [Thermoanaerobaculia bacterium]
MTPKRDQLVVGLSLTVELCHSFLDDFSVRDPEGVNAIRMMADRVLYERDRLASGASHGEVIAEEAEAIHRLAVDLGCLSRSAIPQLAIALRCDWMAEYGA